MTPGHSTPEARKIAAGIISQLHEVPGNTAAIRALRKQISQQLAAVDRKTIIAVAHELIRHAPYGRFVAYEIVHYHAPTMAVITLEEVESLGRGISDWAAVDTFSCYIAGPAWHAGRIKGKTIRQWARSHDPWWRRAALVSTVPLNSREWAGTESARRTLAVCALLTSDRNDMVVKALSWALRALARRDPGRARKFLSAHPNELAARVVRELENKLHTGLKNPRKLGPFHGCQPPRSIRRSG